jgi:hypothetical protein
MNVFAVAIDYFIYSEHKNWQGFRSSIFGTEQLKVPIYGNLFSICGILEDSEYHYLNLFHVFSIYGRRVHDPFEALAHSCRPATLNQN